MSAHVRRFTLTVHTIVSVGWLGAVLAYLALAIAGLASTDIQMVRASYLSMNWVAQFVIVPLSLAAVLTGLIQSLGTEWGLFRYYWIVAKFALTVVAVAILLLHMPTISRMSQDIRALTESPVDHHMQIHIFVHAAGGLVVLIAATALSIYKPWGRTPFGAA